MTHEEMVEELWNREKIRELTCHYGLAIEAQDEERLLDLFSADAFIDFSSIGQGVTRGHAAMKAFYRKTWPLSVKPFFTNHMISLDGDSASGFCSLENRASRDGESLIGAGRLHDTYEKIDGTWKFGSRRVEMFYLVPLSQGWAEAEGPGHL
jgi:ketosteroid isomerase-like protein